MAAASSASRSGQIVKKWVEMTLISSVLAQITITQKDLDDLGKVEWGALWPAWIAGGGILVLLLADLALPKARLQALAWIAFAILALATASTFWMDTTGPGGKAVFQNMIAADDLSRYMGVIIFGVAALVVLASPDYLSRIGVEARSEYYGLILAAACGMWLLTVAAHFMVFFIALEL